MLGPALAGAGGGGGGLLAGAGGALATAAPALAGAGGAAAIGAGAAQAGQQSIPGLEPQPPAGSTAPGGGVYMGGGIPVSFENPAVGAVPEVGSPAPNGGVFMGGGQPISLGDTLGGNGLGIDVDWKDLVKKVVGSLSSDDKRSTLGQLDRRYSAPSASGSPGRGFEPPQQVVAQNLIDRVQQTRGYYPSIPGLGS